MSDLAPFIASAVRDRYGDVKLVYAHISSIDVVQSPPRLKKVARRVEQEVRERVPADLSHERLVEWATLANAMGLVREDDLPAPRALVRSVLGGRPMPKINVVVDIANTVALSHLTPVGVFDLDRLTPPISLRLAESGESLVPIGSATAVDCVPNEIVYGDGASVFSRYARDAERSKVTEDTTRILAVIDGTPNMAQEDLVEARDQFVGLLKDVVPTALLGATDVAEVR